MSSTLLRRLLVPATLASLAAVAMTAQPPKAPRATARDRVGAADTTCDDLCRHERMMDRRYGRDRERATATARVAERPAARAANRAAATPRTPVPVRKAVP